LVLTTKKGEFTSKNCHFTIKNMEKKKAKNGELTSQSAGLSSKTGELMTSKNLDFISKEW